VTGRRFLIALFVLMLPFVGRKIRGADEIQYFSHLRSMVFDQDLDFANEYQYFYDRDPEGLRGGFKETYLDRREVLTQRNINFTPIGCAVLWSPFYLLAHAGVLAARSLGSGVAADGFSTPYVAAVGYASALYAFVGLLLTHSALRRWADMADTAATAAVAALWWGTPLLYYMTIAPAFSHATSMMTVGLVVWLSLRAWSRDTWTWRETVVIGLAGGVAALVYEKELLYLSVPGLLLAAWALKTRRWAEAATSAVAMGATAVLILVPQILAYRTLNGTFGPSPLVRRKMDYACPHCFEVLVDPGRGLFLWAPLVLVALVGLVVFWNRRRDALASALLAAFVLQIWICGSVQSWHLAGAFGSRRFVSSAVVLAFGLATLVGWARARVGRAVTYAALLLFVWWNVSLMVQFGLRLMDRQRLEWPQVAKNQVIEVPRHLFRAVWLYFADPERLLKETR